MEWWHALTSTGDVGAKSFVAVIVLLILTDKLVIGSRLRKVEAERDEWRGIALRAMGVAEKVVHDETNVSSVLKKAGDEMTAQQERDYP